MVGKRGAAADGGAAPVPASAPLQSACKGRLAGGIGRGTAERLPDGADLDRVHRQCAAARRFALRGGFIFSGCKVGRRRSGSFRLIAKKRPRLFCIRKRDIPPGTSLCRWPRCGQAEQKRRLARNPDRFRRRETAAGVQARQGSGEECVVLLGNILVQVLSEAASCCIKTEGDAGHQPSAPANESTSRRQVLPQKLRCGLQPAHTAGQWDAARHKRPSRHGGRRELAFCSVLPDTPEAEARLV